MNPSLGWSRLSHDSTTVDGTQTMVLPWTNYNRLNIQSLTFWVSNQGPNDCQVMIAASPDDNHNPDVDSDSRTIPAGASWAIDRLGDRRKFWAIFVKSSGTSHITFGVDIFRADGT